MRTSFPKAGALLFREMGIALTTDGIPLPSDGNTFTRGLGTPFAKRSGPFTKGWEPLSRRMDTRCPEGTVSARPVQDIAGWQRPTMNIFNEMLPLLQ